MKFFEFLVIVFYVFDFYGNLDYFVYRKVFYGGIGVYRVGFKVIAKVIVFDIILFYFLKVGVFFFFNVEYVT